MNKSTATMNKSTAITREEQRRAQARKNAEYHTAKIQRQKDFLARHPEIAAQQAREKEEKRLNYETIRMLQSMKEDTPKQPKYKPKNAFAALADGSDTEEEIEEPSAHPDTEEPTAPATPVTEEPTTTSSKGDERTKINWADTDSEDEN